MLSFRQVRAAMLQWPLQFTPATKNAFLGTGSCLCLLTPFWSCQKASNEQSAQETPFFCLAFPSSMTGPESAGPEAERACLERQSRSELFKTQFFFAFLSSWDTTANRYATVLTFENGVSGCSALQPSGRSLAGWGPPRGESDPLPF